MTTTEAPARHVALVKPEKDAKGFGRGERIILVDGVRWGRTRIAFHSRYGTSHTFEDSSGFTLTEPYDPPRRHGSQEHDITVRISRRRFDKDADKRPTDALVLEKAEELVRTGKLRDPAIVEAEHKEAAARYRANRAADDAKKAAEFKAKAQEALGNANVILLGADRAAPALDRIVEAMLWAQSQ